jgi:hypothetical protein
MDWGLLTGFVCFQTLLSVLTMHRHYAYIRNSDVTDLANLSILNYKQSWDPRIKILWHIHLLLGSEHSTNASMETATNILNTGTWPSRLGVSNEPVKYSREFCGTWTRKWLLWQSPEAIVQVNYRPSLSYDRVLNIMKATIVIKFQMEARHQLELNDNLELSSSRVHYLSWVGVAEAWGHSGIQKKGNVRSMNCRMCELAIAPYWTVIKSWKCPINPVTNPNLVHSHYLWTIYIWTMTIYCN